MPRRKLVPLLLLSLLTASTTAAQSDAPETRLVALRAPNGAEVPSRTVRNWLSEPPPWMVWLSGLAVAAVIVVRRSRRSGP